MYGQLIHRNWTGLFHKNLNFNSNLHKQRCLSQHDTVRIAVGFRRKGFFSKVKFSMY